MKKAAFILLLVCFLASSLLAQEAYYTDAQKKLMSRRAAMLDAYRQLGEMIQGVKIDSQTTVKDFVTESDEIRATMDSFVLRGAQVVATRYLPDQTCEVDMQVTLSDIVGFLKIAQSQHNVGKFQRTNFDAMDSYNSNRIFRVTGTGAQPGGMSAQQAQALRDENANLKAQVEALTQQLLDAQNSKNSFYSEYSSLESKYKSSQEKYGSLESQNNNLASRCATLESQNSELLAKFNDLEGRYGQTSSDLFKAWEQLQSLKKQAEDSNRMFTDAKKQADESNRLLAEARKQTEDSKKQLSTLQSTIATLQTFRQRYEEVMTENRSLKEQVSTAQNLRSHLNQILLQLDNLNQSHQKLSKENQSLLQTNQTLQNSNQSLQSNAQLLEKKLREQQNLALALENSQRMNQEMAIEKRKFELQVQDLQNKLDTLGRENSQLSQSLQQLRSQVDARNVWKNATPSQKLMARRAAMMDGYRQLLETVQGLRINSTTLVRDFVTEKDEIVGETSGFLRGAQVVAERYLPDGTCEVDMVINTNDFILFLQEKSNQYQSKVSPNEMKNLQNYYKESLIKATGTGAMK